MNGNKTNSHTCPNCKSKKMIPVVRYSGSPADYDIDKVGVIGLVFRCLVCGEDGSIFIPRKRKQDRKNNKTE